jgi:hypothetical protein
MIRRLFLLAGAFVAGWCVGAVVLIGVASWQLLREMEQG